MIRKWLTSPYLRPVMLLASGSGLAQVLGLLVTPIVTRLYLPSDYGALTVYSSIVAILAAIAGGRYEIAVVLPSDSKQGESDAISLVRVSLLCVAATSVLTLLAVAALVLWSEVPSVELLGFWAFAIPLGVLLSATSTTLSAYATRRRMYGRIARVAPLQKVGSAAVQVSAGLAKWGMSGLMLATLVAPLVGLGVLSQIYQQGRRELVRSKLSLAELRAIALQYSDFPRLSTWFALLNALAWNTQILVLAQYYSVSETGQYGLAKAVIVVPTSLVLTGVSQVYLRECAARAHDPAAAKRLAVQTLKALVAASLPLFVAIFLVSKHLFGIVFGEEWVAAGAITIAMIPLLWARFLTTSLTTTFNVYRRQGLLLAWQVAALTLTLLGYILGGRSGWDIVSTTWLASLMTAPAYLALIPMVFGVLHVGKQETDGTQSGEVPSSPV